MKTFRCNFAHGVSATISVTDEFPEAGKSHIQRVEWTGNMRKINPNAYVAWINSVNSVLAAEWGKRIMHVFTLGNNMKNAQVWVYEPGEPPKLVPTPDFTEDVKSNCVGVLKHEKNLLHVPK
jgi:hypothetical protein